MHGNQKGLLSPEIRRILTSFPWIATMETRALAGWKSDKNPLYASRQTEAAVILINYIVSPSQIKPRIIDKPLSNIFRKLADTPINRRPHFP